MRSTRSAARVLLPPSHQRRTTALYRNHQSSEMQSRAVSQLPCCKTQHSDRNVGRVAQQLAMKVQAGTVDQHWLTARSVCALPLVSQVAIKQSPLNKGKVALAVAQAGEYDQAATKATVDQLIADNAVRWHCGGR